MLDVYGTSCPAARPRWSWRAATGQSRYRRVQGFAAPAFAAAMLSALILHLLLTLGAHLGGADAAGVLTVAAGMAAVLVVLLPFALLSVRRALDALSAVRTRGRAAASPQG